tara:strand:- start:5914 stop:6879 length:966 start_codon:yes stop_codon:yes gene_type:complete
MGHYLKTDKDYWAGREDSKLKERFWQLVQNADLHNLDNIKIDNQKSNIALIGFACDLGVLKNKGRLGAFDGSNSLRKNLINLAFDKSINIYDFGNIICDSKKDELDDSQCLLGDAVFTLLDKGFFPVVLGGGHETAYGHYLGIKNTKYSKNIGIINFDAHFDLRELLPNNQGSSGTPFRQIYLDRKKNNLDFNYLCVGIQENANTKSLFDYANETKTEYILAEEVFTNNLNDIKSKINKFIEKVDYIYITICLDVFSQSVAPGVSAPQAFGLMPNQVKSLLKIIKSSKKLITADIVELNPKYDIDNMTAKLGASLVLDLIK